jgi:hypothetical protein
VCSPESDLIAMFYNPAELTQPPPDFTLRNFERQAITALGWRP